MKHTAYQPPGPRLEVDCDYVVVGSGAGGSCIAVTLARGGAKVCVVEAGAWRDPKDYPLSMLGVTRDFLLDWGTTVAKGSSYWPIVQGSAVGGTTVINSAIVVRTPADIFEQWEREHGVGGDALRDEIWRHQEKIEEELRVSRPSDEALGRTNMLALKADKLLGLGGELTLRNIESCRGDGLCLQGCPGGFKRSTNLNYIPEVVELGGHILSCAPASKVLFEGRRAVGVEGRFRHPVDRRKGADFSVRARKGVVMAASVTRSSLLLHDSGVRLPALNQYFRAHPGTGIFGLYDERVDMEKGATQGWASVKYRNDPGFKLETLSLPVELVASRLKGAGKILPERVREYPYLAMWCFALRAESVGRITRNFMRQPMVLYDLNRRDMEVWRQGAVAVAKMHFAAGAKEVVPGVHGVPYKLKEGDLHLLEQSSLDPGAWIGISSHLFGGCVMGSDTSRSVCDGLGRVHGYEDLVVADASVIPTNLGVNPQHTILGLARSFGEAMLNN